MSHCYGYDSMSDLLEAGRKEREKKAEQREIDTLKARIRKLEDENAELTKENNSQKRVIRILENKVLELKGKPVPMEPRLPTCDALCRPRYILQSNCSNAKEAGE